MRWTISVALRLTFRYAVKSKIVTYNGWSWWLLNKYKVALPDTRLKWRPYVERPITEIYQQNYWRISQNQMGFLEYYKSHGESG